MVLDDRAAPSASRSLASDLEARRLAHRTRRMAFAISALQDRAESYRRRGSVPRPLNDAIAGFAADLRRDRARLRELGQDGR